MTYSRLIIHKHTKYNNNRQFKLSFIYIKIHKKLIIKQIKMTFKEYLEIEKNGFNEILKRNSENLVDLDHKALNVKYILDKEIEDLYGFEFYQIMRVLKLNIDQSSKVLFASIPLKKVNALTKTEDLNTFEKFVNQFLIDQKKFAYNASIDPTRLNKILKRERKDFYAYEVYRISISEKIKATSAFNKLYKAVSETKNG